MKINETYVVKKINKIGIRNVCLKQNYSAIFKDSKNITILLLITSELLDRNEYSFVQFSEKLFTLVGVDNRDVPFR